MAHVTIATPQDKFSPSCTFRVGHFPVFATAQKWSVAVSGRALVYGFHCLLFSLSLLIFSPVIVSILLSVIYLVNGRLYICMFLYDSVHSCVHGYFDSLSVSS